MRAPLGQGAAFWVVGTSVPTAGPGPSPVSFAATDVELLNLMGYLAAPHGFDAVSGFAPVSPPQRLTDMTLDERLRYQEPRHAMGTVSFAAGRCQFIYPPFAGWSKIWVSVAICGLTPRCGPICRGSGCMVVAFSTVQLTGGGLGSPARGQRSRARCVCP